MYKYRKDGISVLAIVDKRRMKNNGLFPVKIEVVYRRVQKYYPTSQDVSPEEWENFKTSRRQSDKCHNIENSFYLIQRAVEYLAERGEFSFRRLEGRLGRCGDTINEHIRMKMNVLMKEEKVNSFYRYRSALHALESYGGRKITFDTISPEWLKACEKRWSHDGMNSTTINIYMRVLRSVFNSAADDGIIRDSHNPFSNHGYKIPAPQSREMALTKDQINAVRRWKGDRQIEYWRDLWMFSYLCNGINFRDMIFLKYEDIHDGEIEFVRSKTSRSYIKRRVIRAPITVLMREIMERSGNGAESNGCKFIFRHANGRETPLEASLLVRKIIASCNAAMKILAADIGIPPFSTYAARHSFATILKKSGTDISFISESLGHKSIATTQTYIAPYDKAERCLAAAYLI